MRVLSSLLNEEGIEWKTKSEISCVWQSYLEMRDAGIVALSCVNLFHCPFQDSFESTQLSVIGRTSTRWGSPNPHWHNDWYLDLGVQHFLSFLRHRLDKV